MIELGTLPPTSRAGLIVGAVLLEAVVLYFGYGALERVAGPPVIRYLKDG